MTLIKGIPANGKVAVLGSGISGLTFTYFLSKLRPDIKFDIYERTNEVGGWIKSQQLQTPTKSILLEKGPRTLRGVSDGTLLIVDILKQLQKEDSIRVLSKDSIANKKYLSNSDHNIVQVPDSVTSGWKFLLGTNIIQPSLIWGFLKEPFIKNKTGNVDESIESFFKRRFGNSILTDSVISAIIHGIYAGDINQLSIKSIFPSIKKLEDEHGSIIKSVLFSKKDKSKEKELSPALSQYETLISPNANLVNIFKSLTNFPIIAMKDGLQNLPITIYQNLFKDSNITFHFNSNITEVNPANGVIVNGNQQNSYDHIRSTIPIKSLAKVLKTSSEVQQDLKSLEYVSIFLVNVFSTKSNLIPKGKHGFGFLVPKLSSNHNDASLLGVIYDSDVEQNVKPLIDDVSTVDSSDKEYNKITLMLGGHYYNKISIPSSSLNIKIVKDILEEYLGLDLQSKNLIIRDESNITDKTINELNENDLLISYNLHNDCIPQYNVGYDDLKQKVLSEFNDNTKLSFGGMAFGDGVGVPDCVLNGLKDALKLKQM
ncbi:mitochondrial protoporphyrinogen oxidase [Scheffersomyces coipomensis]|uniref:mitochondrial protoporphyrinogen oxidase n=1 Tax=Scheffersomyces coipomensis TaxID=1788519 RepID=UPI00315DA306